MANPLSRVDDGPFLAASVRGAARSIRAAGNYGEMFERNLGKGSALGLERGPNRLWKDGGLMYAPPIK